MVSHKNIKFIFLPLDFFRLHLQYSSLHLTEHKGSGSTEVDTVEPETSRQQRRVEIDCTGYLKMAHYGYQGCEKWQRSISTSISVE